MQICKVRLNKKAFLGSSKHIDSETMKTQFVTVTLEKEILNYESNPQTHITRHNIYYISIPLEVSEAYVL